MNATDVFLPASTKLAKSLRARHLAMISIGGIIGAGVFVGSMRRSPPSAPPWC